MRNRDIEELNLLEYKFLGKGNNGAVYLMPGNKAIKICNVVDSCAGEAEILEYVNGNKYFPKIYEYGGNYIVRDFVDGVCFRDYIKRNGLSEELAEKLIELLKEFKKLKFKKQDVRCKDIYILKDGNLMIIDPKGFLNKKRNYPRHLCKGLDTFGCLEVFLEVLKKRERGLYVRWIDSLLEDREERAKEYLALMK